jgi:hypothetical protein
MVKDAEGNCVNEPPVIIWKTCENGSCGGSRIVETPNGNCYFSTFTDDAVPTLCKEKNICLHGEVDLRIACDEGLNMTILDGGKLYTTQPLVFDGHTFNVLYREFNGGTIILKELSSDVTVEEILRNPDPYRFDRGLLVKTRSCTLSTLGVKDGKITQGRGESLNDATYTALEYYGVTMEKFASNMKDYWTGWDEMYHLLDEAGISEEDEFGHIAYNEVVVPPLPAILK